MAQPRILVYILRRDLRLSDNPVFHEVLKSQRQSHHPCTHLLPLYIFPAQQVEVSGFLSSDSTRSPYPEARSNVAGFWRCGRHRAKFLAETVFDLKASLEKAMSGLELRVGLIGDVLRDVLEAYKENSRVGKVTDVWMTAEEGVEEMREERAVRAAAEQYGVEFRCWQDEKYFIDDRDLPLKSIKELPDLFTSFRHKVEPLRKAPRPSLEVGGTLPPMPEFIPPQSTPFMIASSLVDVTACLVKPLEAKPDLTGIAPWPPDAKSAHPFKGGETTGHERIKHLISSGAMTTYKDTRNGMIGTDFSTKLSAWLSLGSITARQIHEYLLDFEDGRTELGKGTQGYKKGENKGTGWVRFELLWRDYMRLCTRKYKARLFRVEGFRNNTLYKWKYADNDDTRKAVDRFLHGNTGTGLIDASMRELWHTGYTSNRARQNVGSFLARHLGIDWRIGAEWYESTLVDYDLSSNWANWQAVAITDRVFNPVKQSFDYDKGGEYIKLWMHELRKIEDMESVFQAWKLPQEQRTRLGLEKTLYVSDPMKRIEYRSGKTGGKDGGGLGRGGGGYYGRGRGHMTRGQMRKGMMDKAGPS